MAVRTFTKDEVDAIIPTPGLSAHGATGDWQHEYLGQNAFGHHHRFTQLSTHYTIRMVRVARNRRTCTYIWSVSDPAGSPLATYSDGRFGPNSAGFTAITDRLATWADQVSQESATVS